MTGWFKDFVLWSQPEPDQNLEFQGEYNQCEDNLESQESLEDKQKVGID